jgi:uncharacterized protein YktB (UPF0637 family)
MPQDGFTALDFNCMRLPGLDERMSAIREQIQPQFQRIADQLIPFLNEKEQADPPFCAHIARHARRTIHPPESTWLALAQDKRGYKKHPHFQFGIWPSHLFFWLAFIDDYPHKKELGEAMLTDMPTLMQTFPSYFAWSSDHTSADYALLGELTANGLKQLLMRLTKVKKAELLCGVVIPKQEAITKSEEQLIAYLKEQILKLLPLYELALRSTI